MKKLYLTLGLALALPLAASAVDDWPYSGGSGTKDDPYQIKSALDMYNLYVKVTAGQEKYEGKYFAMQNDISYKDTLVTGIAMANAPFQGTFDGQGHKFTDIDATIAKSSASWGIFANIGESATLKNIVIDGVKLTAAGNFTNAGVLCSKSSGLIENCHVTNAQLDYTLGTVTNQSAGLVDYVTETGVVRDCSFSGTVYTGNYFGPIASRVNYGLIENCTSDANIIVNRSGAYVGGIASTAFGRVSSPSEPGNANLKGCTFRGNISISAGSISGTYIGGIVGETSASYVSGCVNEGTVMAMGHNGGIAGHAFNGSYVADSYNAGLVTDIFIAHDSTTVSYQLSDNLGGIVGNVQKSYVARCFNVGQVRSYRTAGGIVGTTDAADIADCYNAGLVDAPFTWTSGSVIEQCGGILGAKTTAMDLYLTNCLSIGTVNNNSAARYKDSELIGYILSESSATIKNCYYDTKSAGWGTSTIGPKTTAELTSGQALDGFDASVWTFTAGLYPRLTASASTQAALVGAVPYFIPDNSTRSRLIDNVTLGSAEGVSWSVKGSDAATISESTLNITRTDLPQDLTLTCSAGDASRTAYLTVYPNISNGSGTQEDPYTIATYAELKHIASLTNNGVNFEGEYIKLTADIDMENDATFECFSKTEANTFYGTFDGDGHALKNWKLTNNTTTLSYGGLFAYVGQGATIKNLIIDSSCTLGLYRYSGVIAAYTSGTIENCRVLPTKISTASAGGEIGGIAYTVNATGAIIDCYVGANFTLSGSCPRVAGIAQMNSGTIRGCQYAGTLAGTASQTLGGITAQNKGLIENCLFSGGITANYNVGGISYSNLSAGIIRHCLVTATIGYTNNIESVGAIAVSNGGTIEDCVYDSQISLYNSLYSNGITGKLTREIISDWKGEGWSNDGERYPQLEKFASESMAMQTSFPLIFADGDTRIAMTEGSAAQAYLATGLTWKLDDGDDFTYKTATGVLSFDGATSYCDDNIFQTYNGNKRTIKISALGTFLTGAGTEANPWIIATEANLRKIATEANKTSNTNDYAGHHFKITADISLSSTAFTPIAAATSSGANKVFKGIIHGEGHSISGLTISTSATNTGLVGYLGRGGRIENLTIESGSVVSTKANIGAFAGYVNGGSIVNCTNKATVTCSTASIKYVGGVAGYVLNAPEFSDNTNYGDVTNKYWYTGGVAGDLEGYYDYRNLTNYGAVTGSHYSAGVVGNVLANSLDSLTNYGVITAVTAGSMIGGVVGTLNACKSLSHARNYGEVKDVVTSAAGIVGRYWPQSNTANAVVISDCLNAANITATKSNAAGIVGATDNYAITVARCVNTGAITNTVASVAADAGGASGIVGIGVPTIVDCWNAGVISAQNNVGGLIGRPNANNSAVVITRSLSTGWVEGYGTSCTNVGAITGYNSTKATYTDVVYDKQLCEVGAAGKNDYDGITGSLTADIAVADVALAKGEGAQAWTAVAGRYPYPTALANEAAVVACSLPVFLDANDTRSAVTTDFRVGTLDGATWTLDTPLEESEGTVTVNAEPINNVIKLTGTYNVSVGYGDYTHTYPLTFDYKRSATALEGIQATQQTAVAVNGGILVPAGPYRVAAISGAIIASGNASQPSVIRTAQGVYIVVTTTGAQKVVVR